MNIDSLLTQQTIQYKLSSLFFGFCLLILILLAMYFMWRWCNDNDDSRSSSGSSGERLFMKPVYAHEIEPGIVVLQSENGDYFKILKEYDMKPGQQYGSITCTRPEIPQPVQNTSAFGTSRDFPPVASAPPRLDDNSQSLLGRSTHGPGFRSVDFAFGPDNTSPPPYNQHR